MTACRNSPASSAPDDLVVALNRACELAREPPPLPARHSTVGAARKGEASQGPAHPPGGAGSAGGSAAIASLPELCAELRPRFKRIARHYRIGPEDADDLLQTTLLLALMQWEEIRDPVGWLLVTLRNLCILHWRERHRREKYFVALTPAHHEQLATAPAQEDRGVLAELDELGRRELPAMQRRVLVLRYGLGLSPDEVAAASGLAKGSVRKTLNRALHALRDAAGIAPAKRRPRPPGCEHHHLVTELRHAGSGAARAWGRAVEAFLAERPFSQPTVDTYGRCLATAGGRLGFPAPHELDAAAVAEYGAALMADGVGEAQVKVPISALRSFMRWAVENRAAAVDVAQVVRAPASAERPPR